MKHSSKTINWEAVQNALSYVVFGLFAMVFAGIAEQNVLLVIAAGICAFGVIGVKRQLPKASYEAQVVTQELVNVQELSKTQKPEEMNAEASNEKIDHMDEEKSYQFAKHITPEEWLEQEEFTTVQAEKTLELKAVKQGTPSINWEEWVGQKLLQKLGIAVVLIGMIVFLKYSFDNGWIGPHGRIALSIVSAIIMLGLGEWFQKKYPQWFQAFTGGGLALLYFTIWAAHVYYADKLAFSISPLMASVLYSIVTAFGALAAIRYTAQVIAWFTVLGGYLTPMFIQGASDPVGLILYLAILTAGLLTLAWYKKWKYINIVAFVFTQMYLWSKIYWLSETIFSDIQQIIVATGFFALFGILPLLHQFVAKAKTQKDDVVLIVANGVIMLSAVLSAIGVNSDFVPLVYVLLAVVYIGYSAIVVQKRSQDSLLVNTYLVSAVALVAAAMYAELTYELVAAGWAPFSALLVLVSAKLRRTGPWVCAFILLLASLLLLALQIPGVSVANATTEWRPLTSAWSVQSYIVFASLLYWLYQSRALPESVLNKESALQIHTYIHGVIAILVFTFMSLVAMAYGTPVVDWQFDSVVTFAHVLFACIALVVFMATGTFVWFIAACIAQLFTLGSIFIFASTSSLSFYSAGSAVVPFLHVWSLLSVFSLGITAALGASLLRQPTRVASTKVLRNTMVFAVLMQVWVHISVEIWHVCTYFDLSSMAFSRVLGMWWIVFALALRLSGMYFKNLTIHRIGLYALAPAIAKDALLMLSVSTNFYEVALWSVIAMSITLYAVLCTDRDALKWSSVILSIFVVVSTVAGYTQNFVYIVWWSVIAILLAIVGTRFKEILLRYVSIGITIFTAGYNILQSINSVNQGFLSTIWWAIVALVMLTLGFSERESDLRKLGIGLFIATTIKLLLFDFAALSTGIRIGASIAIGILMIIASYFYQRFDSYLKDVS